MTPPPSPDVPAKLQATFDAALRRLLKPGEEVALLNFPKWGNLGDAAIWLGELAALSRVGVRIRYRADSRHYRRRLVADAVGEGGTILLNGGGNMGDVYPVQQRVRKRVLRDFPGARVIQLPQTIWYRNPERSLRFAQACRAHGGFVLMVREERSAQFAREHLGLPPVLAPDAAFGLGPQHRSETPRCDVLWLMRNDQEGIVPPSAGRAGDRRRDWPDKFGRGEAQGRPLRRALLLNRALSLPLDREIRGSDLMAALIARSDDALARRRLELALATIGSARVVVTDRLHGHILCILAGVPHVALDNASGKSRATYETWTSPSPLARFAEGVDQAAELADELLSGQA